MHGSGESTRRREQPRRRARRRLLVGAIATVAIAGVPAAWATHVFGDVPTSSPHHADVAAIAGAGITAGCAPGLYCPGNFVRRDQMASFLARGLGRAARANVQSVVLPPETTVNVASVTITVGGLGTGNQFVRVSGVASVFGFSSECPCIVNADVREVSGAVGPTSFDQAPLVGENQVSVPVEWVFPASPGTHTYVLRVTVFQTLTSWSANGALTATTVPFGPTGASTLGSAP